MMITLLLLSWLGVWSRAPSAIPPSNLTLNQVQKDVARVFGFFSVERKGMLPKPVYSGKGFLTKSVVTALAEVAHVNASAIAFYLVDKNNLLGYVITFIGDQAGGAAREQALMALERLKSENSTSMMVRAMGIWPYLCSNESNESWYEYYDNCHPVRYAISWMSQPELSLPSAVSAWPAVFEEKEVWVTVGASGQDCGSWTRDNWIACGNTFLNTSNLAERMSNLNQHLESIVPAYPKFWSKAPVPTPWEPWARCWNQTGPSWRCYISSCPAAGYDSCGPPDCSPRCKVKFYEFGFELCGRSVSQIRNELQLASSWQQFNMLLQVTAGPKVQSFTCRLTLEVTTGSDFFADVGCTPDGFDPGLFVDLVNPQYYTSNAWLQNMFLKTGLAWKSYVVGMNESGLFYAVHLRAMEKGQSNSTNSTFTWVNFTSLLKTWQCRDILGCDVPREEAPAQVVIEWNVKIVSSDPHSQPWQVPEKIQIPCLVEMQEHRVVLVFKGNSTYPLRGMNGGFSTFTKYHSLEWNPRFVRTYVGDLPSVWSREVQAKYHMPREDLLDWRARQNLTSGKPEGMLRIAAGPTPGSLELSILPQAGGPSTEGKFCFIPADGFHIYQQLCSEYFPIRAQASACAAMEAAEATAKTVVPAAILFSLLVVFAYAC